MKYNQSSLPKRYLARLPAVAGLITLLAAGASSAAVTVNGSFSFANGVYSYSYTVSNFGTSADLAIVDIPVGSGVSITNLVAPTGFGILFDAEPVNLVSFFEDSDFNTTQTFGPDSTSGTFSFDSTSGPAPVSFSALDANGDTFTGVTISAVPEPSSLILFGSAAIPLLISRRRRVSL